MRRVLVAVLVVVALLAGAVPANAGGWAATELDPLPGRIEAGHAYTVGYWLLQHGNHPYGGTEEELGKTGLRFNNGNGTMLEFTGSRLAEPAHYAVAVKLPAGIWRVEAIQGWFSPYEIGTLTVPGGLVLSERDDTMRGGPEVKDYWGEIKPPGYPWDSTAAAQVNVPASSAEPVTAPAQPASGVPAYLLVVVALGAGAVTFVAQRLLTRRRPEPEKPSEEIGEPGEPETEQDVLVIGGR
ncbi:hypothetical protein [Acrocarpospora catenulata]|uniref:hypothetical protein n=1 Tax=Acrocarpospora catenulata TaxID=2836182 RepID=UPI001BDB382B|nr:hypothetical protein [Acrocarpospora catenulata]